VLLVINGNSFNTKSAHSLASAKTPVLWCLRC
jgi:hypothetical protein